LNLLIRRLALVLAAAGILSGGLAALAQTAKPVKVLMISDMEGVDGIFDQDLQCIPLKSPRWEESRKLLTGEINAAVEGLLEGGATDVVVMDGHWDGNNLSVLDIHPKARLLTGTGNVRAFQHDSSYSAEIFIGQHAMAGAENGILGHTLSPDGIQNLWVNGKAVGEIGLAAMHAGSFGIPAIMLSGDTAACKEILDLVPKAECAEVKSGISRTAGFMLSHPAACALIRDKARRAIQRLAEFKPYKVSGPVEIKIEYTNVGTQPIRVREGVVRVDDRTWIVRGKDFEDAYETFWYHL
jgi:D-amino peptidase